MIRDSARLEALKLENELVFTECKDYAQYGCVYEPEATRKAKNLY